MVYVIKIRTIIISPQSSPADIEMIPVPDNLLNEFQLMFKAATDASFVCKKIREKIGGDLGVMTKLDESPVTCTFVFYITTLITCFLI